MFAIDYYHKLKTLYKNKLKKAKYVYIYTHSVANSINDKNAKYIVNNIMITYRKSHKTEIINDVPHDALFLSDNNLPNDVMVQVLFAPLRFIMYEY